ncbi:hypothetical protein U1Q18_047477 [Sarracenia purpurea var. burkii]
MNACNARCISVKIDLVEKKIPCGIGVGKKDDNNDDRWGNLTDVSELGAASSLPIPLPGIPRSSSLDREVYYM